MLFPMRSRLLERFQWLGVGFGRVTGKLDAGSISLALSGGSLGAWGVFGNGHLETEAVSVDGARAGQLVASLFISVIDMKASLAWDVH